MDTDSSTPACEICGYSERACDCHPAEVRERHLQREIAALRAERRELRSTIESMLAYDEELTRQYNAMREDRDSLRARIEAREY